MPLLTCTAVLRRDTGSPGMGVTVKSAKSEEAGMIWAWLDSKKYNKGRKGVWTEHTVPKEKQKISNKLVPYHDNVIQQLYLACRLIVCLYS